MYSRALSRKVFLDANVVFYDFILPNGKALSNAVYYKLSLFTDKALTNKTFYQPSCSLVKH